LMQRCSVATPSRRLRRLAGGSGGNEREEGLVNILHANGGRWLGFHRPPQAGAARRKPLG